MTRRGKSTKSSRKITPAAIDDDDERASIKNNDELWVADDGYDEDIVNVESPSKTFHSCLVQLEQKKESVKENALCSIIELLNSGKEHESLQNNFATSLYRILDLIKRGSVKVQQLASHALGLLAMTLCDSDNAQEIYRESLPALTKAFSKTSKMLDPCVFVTLLNSLAMITFFCASDTEETEAAMKIIWEFVVPRSKFDVVASKQFPASISVAITAWSFLLSTVDVWELNHKNWQGAIAHFLLMLEADHDESVYVSSGEALAVIYERESLNKFFKEEDPINSSTAESTESPLTYSERKTLIKDHILKQLEHLSIKAKTETSLKQSFSNAFRADWDVLKYFKNDNFPQTAQRIYGHKLTLSSWSQMIQLKFLKNFLGEEEFLKHMLENEIFHQLFEFTPIYKEDSEQELYESTMVKIAPLILLPEGQDADLLTRKEKKEEKIWRNSIKNKAKTKMLNKRRTFAEERKGKTYHIEPEE